MVVNIRYGMPFHILNTKQEIPIVLSCDIFHKKHNYNKTNDLKLLLSSPLDKVNNKDENSHYKSYRTKIHPLNQMNRKDNTFLQRLNLDLQMILLEENCTNMSHVHRLYVNHPSNVAI